MFLKSLLFSKTKIGHGWGFFKKKNPPWLMHLVSRFQNGITLGYSKYFWTFKKKHFEKYLKNIFDKNIYKKYFR